MTGIVGVFRFMTQESQGLALCLDPVQDPCPIYRR